MASYNHNSKNAIYHSPNFVYYDIQIRNHGSEKETPSIQLNFQEQRDVPLLNKIRDYNLPSLFFQVQNNQPDINLGVYSLTLEYDDGVGGIIDTQPEFLRWIPQNVDILPPQSPSLNLNKIQAYSEYYFVQNFEYFITILNKTLEEAMVKLKLLTTPVLDTVESAFLVWDTTNVSATLYARESDFNSNSTAKVNIYFNRALYSLFSTFNYIKYSNNVVKNKYYKIIIDSFNGANTVVLPGFGVDELIFTKQEISTIAQWTPLSSILFTTSTIPIEATQLSNPSIYIDGAQYQLTDTYKNFSNIITDLSTDEFVFKPNILYNPTAEYRWVSLGNNDMPLNQIDVSVFYKDKLGIIRPFFLLPGGSASLKILFEKINK